MSMDPSWRKQVEEELKQPYLQELKAFLEEEKKLGRVVYPPRAQIFQAFTETPFDQVKVVIVGQDPYHGEGQAHGLCFSVQEQVKRLPPSLKNIFKELQSDLHISYPQSGCLTPWAKQGVFLLNTTLTVRAKAPRSHHGKGWERFTDAVIQKLAERKDPVIFLLWGQLAQEKAGKILSAKQGDHLILTAAHPSPYSATKFFGCHHFSKANEQLIRWGKKPISWGL